MRLKLTVPFVENPPVPSKNKTVFWDEDPKGFGLAVTAGGHKSFIFNYRHDGKLRRMHFKPGLTLAQARQQARILQGQVATGVDPLGARRKADADKTTTLGHIAEEYFRLEGAELRTRKLREQSISNHILPKFGKRQIHEIERLEIARQLQHIRDTAGPSAAKHAFAFLRVIFNWHAARSNTFNSPLVRGMAKRLKDRRRQRLLTDDEIRAIWRTSQATPTLFGHYVLFLLLTATRRCEASGIRRSEMQGADWIIPEERFKTELQHLVPLSPMALEVLEAIPKIGRGDLIFTTNGRTPFAGFSGFKLDFDKACKVTDWRLHDLRRTARSLMSRCGIEPDIGERCLGHKIGGVRGVYDVYQYANEKRHAFNVLAAELERIVNPPPSNVHTLTHKSQSVQAMATARVP